MTLPIVPDFCSIAWVPSKGALELDVSKSTPRRESAMALRTASQLVQCHDDSLIVRQWPERPSASLTYMCDKRQSASLMYMCDKRQSAPTPVSCPRPVQEVSAVVMNGEDRGLGEADIGWHKQATVIGRNATYMVRAFAKIPGTRNQYFRYVSRSSLSSIIRRLSLSITESDLEKLFVITNHQILVGSTLTDCKYCRALGSLDIGSRTQSRGQSRFKWRKMATTLGMKPSKHTFLLHLVSLTAGRTLQLKLREREEYPQSPRLTSDAVQMTAVAPTMIPRTMMSIQSHMRSYSRRRSVP